MAYRLFTLFAAGSLLLLIVGVILTAAKPEGVAGPWTVGGRQVFLTGQSGGGDVEVLDDPNGDFNLLTSIGHEKTPLAVDMAYNLRLRGGGVGPLWWGGNDYRQVAPQLTASCAAVGVYYGELIRWASALPILWLLSKVVLGFRRPRGDPTSVRAGPPTDGRQPEDGPC